MRVVDCAGRWKYHCINAYEPQRGAPHNWKEIGGRVYCPDCARLEMEAQRAKKAIENWRK